MKRFVAAATLTLALSACAFSAVNRPPTAKYATGIKTSAIYPVGLKQAMKATADSFGSLGYQVLSSSIELSEMKSNVLQVVIPSTCDCGTWNGGTVGGTADSNLRVRFTDASTTEHVATRFDIEFVCGTRFRGHNLYGAVTRDETYACASRGIVESKFWDTVSRWVSNARSFEAPVHSSELSRDPGQPSDAEPGDPGDAQEASEAAAAANEPPPTA
jgi:hypothetical protein